MENLTPLTRLEQFLAKIAGDDIELPEVKTRLEYWLKEISENGGGGGGSSSGLVVNIIEIPPVDPQENPTYRLDKSAGEIIDALRSGRPVVAVGDSGAAYLDYAQNLDYCAYGVLDDLSLNANETYHIVFEGTSYTLTSFLDLDSGYVCLGELDEHGNYNFTNYPFFIEQDDVNTYDLNTPNEGSYSIEITELQYSRTINTSTDQTRYTFLGKYDCNYLDEYPTTAGNK